MPVSFSRNTAELEELIGYRFSDEGLLTEAITHTSFQYENSGTQSAHNERLEFLGDSVLGLVIAETLFTRNRRLSEAGMSRIKSYLVNKSVLYEMATGLSLGKFIRLGRGEDTTGGRQKRSILSDALEAIFGGVFLDSDYETAREIILRLYAHRISEAMDNKKGYDFKSELQERSQALFGTLPDYRIVKQEGEEHQKIFTAEVYVGEKRLGIGCGKSKKEAQMQAAGEALDEISSG
jgi:ribonuclease-3